MRIVSWNLFSKRKIPCEPDYAVTGLSGFCNRLPLIFTTLHRIAPKVALLQEVWNVQHVRDLFAETFGAQYHLHWTPHPARGNLCQLLTMTHRSLGTPTFAHDRKLGVQGTTVAGVLFVNAHLPIDHKSRKRFAKEELPMLLKAFVNNNNPSSQPSTSLPLKPTTAIQSNNQSGSSKEQCIVTTPQPMARTTTPQSSSRATVPAPKTPAPSPSFPDVCVCGDFNLHAGSKHYPRERNLRDLEATVKTFTKNAPTTSMSEFALSMSTRSVALTSFYPMPNDAIVTRLTRPMKQLGLTLTDVIKVVRTLALRTPPGAGSEWKRHKKQLLGGAKTAHAIGNGKSVLDLCLFSGKRWRPWTAVFVDRNLTGVSLESFLRLQGAEECVDDFHFYRSVMWGFQRAAPADFSFCSDHAALIVDLIRRD